MRVIMSNNQEHTDTNQSLTINTDSSSVEQSKQEPEIIPPRKTIIEKRKSGGGFWKMLTIIALCFVLTSVGSSFYASYKRDAEYSLSTHIDRTAMKLFSDRQLEDNEVALILKSQDGKLLKLVVEKNEADQFINQSLKDLEEQRALIKQQISDDVKNMFSLAFADQQEDIEKYADWFFEWKRSYIILKETLTSTATHIVEVGEVETLNVAVERDLKNYFMTHYQARVLKPELRDPVITAAFQKIAERAHNSYRSMVAQNDLKLQLFLQRHTNHLQEISLSKTEQAIMIDWDAQKWKAPSYLLEDRAMDAVQGFGIIAVSGVAGRATLAPVIRAASSRAIGALSTRFASAISTEVIFGAKGAVGGSAVNPGGGTIIGAILGVGIGLFVDYLVNEAQESIKRDDFVKANTQALEATKALWENKLSEGLHNAVDIWFDDTRIAIVKSQTET